MASSSEPRKGFQVFMSRILHLYAALDLLTGISTYSDTEDLLTGISYTDTEDLKAIEESLVEDQTANNDTEDLLTGISYTDTEDLKAIEESLVEDQTTNKLSQTKSSLQVYVSFRGADVRNNFLGHLYTALDVLTGISPYIDSEELSKGGLISPLLMRAIEESHAAIIIFSKNFASSRWCLEELVKIMECKEQKGLIVFPVFYNVEPYEVRMRIQGGSYEVAMAKNEVKFGKDSEIVKRWKKALVDASNLSGWILNGCEATLIKDIAKHISELKRFDVFLSFRGKDVRENFVNSLNEALVRKRINTFMDSENLLMGQDFPPALKDAIEQSCMYVVVFSENYAESWWCLKELVQILERKNRRKQPMLPIFYQVEPGKVRGQKQSYGIALAKHEIEFGKRKVKKWREALSEAANVNGMHLRDGNRDASIPSIVQKIEIMMAEIRSKQG